MHQELTQSGLGQGIYSVADAARYTGIPGARIRRWSCGYQFGGSDGPSASRPVIRRDHDSDPANPQLSFLDLIEVRVVDAFLRLGVSWPEVRRASAVAVEMLKTPHPFSTFHFRTDGRSIFARISNQVGEGMLQLAKRQHVFKEIIEPTLRDLEFSGEELLRWWPMGQRRRVVIDPARSFGRPVGSLSGVPTEILAAYAATTSCSDAAKWFEVEVSEVRHALQYERRAAA